MREPATIIAIDAATTSGIAVLVPGQPEGGICLYSPALYGFVKGASTEVISEVLRDIIERVWSPDIRIVIEYPYLGKNPHSTLICCAVTTRWETVAQLLGMRADLVPANTWQIQQLGRGGSGKREQRKKLAQSLVLGTMGIRCSQDEADALCLAVWSMRIETNETGMLCRIDSSIPARAVHVRW